MYIAIVITPLILHYLFAFLEITPESARAVSEVAQFDFAYTFWLNLFFVAVTGIQIILHRRHLKERGGKMDQVGGLTLKRAIVYLFTVVLGGGLIAWLLKDWG